MKIIAITPNNKFDAVAPLVIEGLYSLGHHVIATDYGNEVKKAYTDEEVIFHSKDADYIFVIWGKVRGNMPPKYYLLDRINRPEDTIYIDGSEWTCSGYPEGNEKIQSPWQLEENIGKEEKISTQIYNSKLDPSKCKGSPWVNQSMLDYCKLYFKRECYEEDLKTGIIPFNVGCLQKYFGNFKNVKKDIDIFCSYGHLYTGLRYETYNACKDLQSQGYNVVFSTKMSHRQYLETIARSKIAISAWGAGNSCMRLWEIMANKTCCFRQKTEILFPNEPEDGNHCVVYENIEEFNQKIKNYLKNPDECIRIGINGYNHTLKHHVGNAKVKNIFDILKDIKK